MTITIDLPMETEAKIRKRAKSRGQDVSAFVIGLVEREVKKPEHSIAENAGPVMTLAEAAAPIHEAFEKSGMTQEELDDLTDELIREVRAEKRTHLR